MAYVIIPPCCEKLTIFWLIFTNILSNSTDFDLKIWLIYNDSSKILSKISPKIENFGQSAPKICGFFLLIVCSKSALKVFTKLHNSSCKNTKFSSFWGKAHPPQDTPCAHKHEIVGLTHHQIIPQMLKMDLCPCIQVQEKI